MEIGTEDKRLWVIFGRNPINMHKVAFALWGFVAIWRWKIGFDIRLGDRKKSPLHEIDSRPEPIIVK